MRWAAQATGRGRRRATRVRTGALPRDPSSPSEAGLRVLRSHRAGGGTESTDRPRHPPSKAPHPRAVDCTLAGPPPITRPFAPFTRHGSNRRDEGVRRHTGRGQPRGREPAAVSRAIAFLGAHTGTALLYWTNRAIRLSEAASATRPRAAASCLISRKPTCWSSTNVRLRAAC
ncbi:hypothetical protein BCEP4_430030 [Burkholderia cepacia]|nr:hypothetical protein BCEP4_430030 [Burkholderia cepacia]